jgi:hypothetical protein
MLCWQHAFNSRGVCWSFRLQPDALYLENPKGKLKYQYSTPFMAEHHFLNAAVEPKWRHLALVLNAHDDTVSFWVDGMLGWKGVWGSAVADADCADRKLAFGRRFPGWTNGLQVGIYDLRLYVGEALSADNIQALAHEQLAGLAAADRCLLDYKDLDTQWEDEHGRGCSWYALHRNSSPAVCHLPEPQKFCPVACITVQPCFEPQTLVEHFQLWHRIQSIGRKTSRGTFCIDTEGVDTASAKQEIRATCDAWVQSGMPAPHKVGWLADYEQSTGRRFDMFNASSVCDDVASSIDDEVLARLALLVFRLQQSLSVRLCSCVIMHGETDLLTQLYVCCAVRIFKK